MSRIIIRQARLIDPQHQQDCVTDLYIAEGKVAAIGKAPDGFSADKTIDASKHWLIPGIVDLCARLREPGLEQVASIKSETHAAASAGITTLCIPPDTDPVIDEPAVVELIHRKARKAKKSLVYTLGALTAGLKGEHLSEMAALKSAGCLGVSNCRINPSNSLVLRRAFEYASTHDITVFIEAHDASLAADGCAHEGAIANRLGLASIPVAAETAAIAQVLEIMRDTDVRVHFGRLSCGRSVELINEARAAGLKVSADVAAHQLHLTDMDISSFNSLYHVIPPLRTQRDMETLKHAVAEGLVNGICSDHQPHEPDAKLAPFPATQPGISSLETLLPLTLKLVEQGDLSLNSAIASLTCNPAAILGLDLGHLGVGASANLCLIDPEKEWTLSQQSMLSQGRNTPFHGWNFRGEVTLTMCEGKTIFNRDT